MMLVMSIGLGRSAAKNSRSLVSEVSPLEAYCPKEAVIDAMSNSAVALQ